MKEMEIVFEWYTEKDFDELKEMAFALQEEDPADLPMTEAKIIKTASESLACPEKIQIFMFKSDGATIGYGMLTFIWSNEYGGDVTNIDEVYIKKGYRNRQAASSFFRHVLATYKDTAMFEIEATPSNEGALSLYKKFGFELSVNTHLRRLPDKI